MFRAALWTIGDFGGAVSSSRCQGISDAGAPAERAVSEIPKEAAGPMNGPATLLLSNNVNLDFDANPHDYLRQKVAMLWHL